MLVEDRRRIIATLVSLFSQARHRWHLWHLPWSRGRVHWQEQSRIWLRVSCHRDRDRGWESLDPNFSKRSTVVLYMAVDWIGSDIPCIPNQ